MQCFRFACMVIINALVNHDLKISKYTSKVGEVCIDTMSSNG